MNKLRPVGMEFEYAFPPLRSSTKTCWTVFRYRVVAHAKCAAGPWPNAPTWMAEHVEPIAQREIWVSEIIPDKQAVGGYRWKVPDELVGMLGTGTEARSE